MHSVFVHLVNVTRVELTDHFDRTAVQGLRDHWYCPNRADPVFTIRFPHAGSEYRDAESKKDVLAVMGREPDITVQIDLGAKHPGHKEVREYLVKFLGDYSGVALDELSRHVWTVDELRADKHVNSFAFADHASWRKLHTIAHLPHPQHPPSGATQH